jgi:glycerol uptake facilitator-like aquaporin
MSTRAQKLFAEGFGTAALLAIIVGSGHMGQMLAQGNAAIALLANSIATGLGLWVLIELFAPISGAHFNPVVSLVFACRGETAWSDAAMYILVQISGAMLGVIAAHLMFDLPLVQIGMKVRTGAGQWFSEALATTGLLLTILLGQRVRAHRVPALVGAYIASAYWFTASTSFANPAVTLARGLTATFAGIRPQDAPAFMLAEFAGAAAALLILQVLLPRPAAVKIGVSEPAQRGRYPAPPS